MKCRNVQPVEGTSSRTSSGLIRRAQANEADAWQELVETYSRRVYRWCRRAGLQPADASNVVQEVLRSVARKLTDFRRDRDGDTFRGWIRRITQNQLRDHFRGQSRRADHPAGGTAAQEQMANLADPPADEELSQTNSYQQIDLATLERVRAEFSDRDWRFFWRVVVDGQSAPEVGTEFGVTANAVRIVKMRVLRRLREALLDEDHD